MAKATTLSWFVVALITATLPVSASQSVDFEQIVPAGSYVVSPELPTLSPDFVLQSGLLHGSNQIAHYADWRYGQARTTELLSDGVRYRLISHVGADWTPAPLQFPLVSANTAGLWQTSAAIPVLGISESVPIQVINGEYRLDNGMFTNSIGRVSAGQLLQLRHVSSGHIGSKTTSTVVIGNITSTFSSVLADMDPDPFSFTAVTAASLGTVYYSNSITVSGIDEATPISVVGGTYNINGGSYTALASTVNAGDAVRIQLTSASEYSTERIATLTIGSQSATFNVTTSAYSSGGGGGSDGGGYGGGGTMPISLLLMQLAFSALWHVRRH